MKGSERLPARVRLRSLAVALVDHDCVLGAERWRHASSATLSLVLALRPASRAGLGLGRRHNTELYCVNVHVQKHSRSTVLFKVKLDCVVVRRGFARRHASTPYGRPPPIPRLPIAITNPSSRIHGIHLAVHVHAYGNRERAAVTACPPRLPAS